MITTERTDPPTTGDEAAILLGFVDFHRRTLLTKADGLDAAQLATRLEPSTMTLGGLLHHLAYVEDIWCSVVLHGNPPAEPWASVDWAADQDWEWTVAATLAPDELRRRYLAAVDRSDELVGQVLRTRGLDAVAARRDRQTDAEISLRWILVHLVEEYARHNGHADLIRESIDGLTGE
ncbi:mini-circle protein [Cellulomonas sp. A375-1]|uniref:DinB family protein n=1 Tax=unclassified Cellulomonas TaxID=2620175 RepID=UPI0006526AC1|nr:MULTISPECIES: DinB family protein [unclassified Cellulomonas]KMM44371.1 mini-circle protein [Cellulomonas sp. A375-1]MCR6704891.1 DinB family protein [Cellulomonas sp.]